MGRRLSALFLLLALAPQPGLTQKDQVARSRTKEAQGGAEFRPKEILCAVVEWNITAPAPVLTLHCPPDEVYAPLAVRIRLSWARPEDVPGDYLDLVAPRGMHTHLVRTEKGLQVRLRIQRDGEKNAREIWVVFNQVDGVALLT